MTIKKIKLKPSYRGFTLAELVIIIVIIGIFVEEYNRLYKSLFLLSDKEGPVIINGF